MSLLVLGADSVVVRVAAGTARAVGVEVFVVVVVHGVFGVNLLEEAVRALDVGVDTSTSAARVGLVQVVVVVVVVVVAVSVVVAGSRGGSGAYTSSAGGSGTVTGPLLVDTCRAGTSSVLGDPRGASLSSLSSLGLQVVSICHLTFVTSLDGWSDDSLQSGGLGASVLPSIQRQWQNRSGGRGASADR